MKRLCTLAGLSMTALVVSSGDAHAYLDPGTGSILLQALIGGIAATSVAIGYYWSKLKSLFTSTSNEKPRQDRDTVDPSGR